MNYPSELLSVSNVKQLLTGSKNCVLAVSGGADSMAIMHWFALHRDQFDQTFSVTHVNHNINPNSKKWGQLVENQCKALDLPVNVCEVDISEFGNNVENAARHARYKVLCASGADSIILGHHANDQCESVFIKLFRGSGLRGLKAMTEVTSCWYNRDIKVIRPMLNVTRGHIMEYVERHQIPYVDDPSNLDTSYDRNFIRNNVWPGIMERFPIADVNTLKSVKHIGEAWQLICELADIDIAKVTLPDGNISWPLLKPLGYLRIKNLLMRVVELRGIQSVKIGHIEQFAQGMVSSDSNSRNELSLAGFRMNKIGNVIFIT